MTRLSGIGSLLRQMENARSRFVWVFQPAEKKLGGSFGSKSSTASEFNTHLTNFSHFCVVWL